MSIPVIKNIKVGDSKNHILSGLDLDNLFGISIQEINGVIKPILSMVTFKSNSAIK